MVCNNHPFLDDYRWSKIIHIWNRTIPASMTHAISLEEKNKAVYRIDRFALYPSPPSFQLIIQNPAVKSPLHHRYGNNVTAHFSPLQQQSREGISWPLEGRIIVITPLQLSTSICRALVHGRQSLMALYQSLNSKLLQ